MPITGRPYDRFDLARCEVHAKSRGSLNLRGRWTVWRFGRLVQAVLACPLVDQVACATTGSLPPRYRRGDALASKGATEVTARFSGGKTGGKNAGG